MVTKHEHRGGPDFRVKECDLGAPLNAGAGRPDGLVNALLAIVADPSRAATLVYRALR